MSSGWRELILMPDKQGHLRVDRLKYELCVLQVLRDRLRCKEIWVVGANRYRNPDDDFPTDFEVQRDQYYSALHLPQEVETFLGSVQREMSEALTLLDRSLPKNPHVRILLDPITLQKRLLLCLYGLSTNTGLKRVSSGAGAESYTDLVYVRRRFIRKEPLREAIAKVVIGVFRVRLPHIWGEATTACASDSKKFGAWDQNLMTKWHVRYGGKGIMIYWHAEKHAACIYSQLKTCSSSEVAAMIEGLLRHDTEMEVEKKLRRFARTK